MQHLIGTFECRVDSKGRIMMPISIKKQMANFISDFFVLKRSVFNPCLELYPMKEWKKLMEKIDKLNRFNKKNNDFIRRFNAGVKTLEMDNSGRFLIPKDLVKHAQIEEEIVISSAINILEIWDKKQYEKVINEATLDFSVLAEEVMGDKNDDTIS